MNEIDSKQKAVQRATLAVALITNFVLPFAITALNIAVPHIGKEFQASTTSLTWIVLSFLLVSCVLSLPFGRIADIHGRRPMLKGGILLFCAASFLNVFAPDMAVFLVFRFLQGVGGAMIFATNTAILIDAYPDNRRGAVLGISVAFVFIGSSVGPVIGGLLTHAYGWRSVFIATAALAMAAFVAALLRSPREESRDEAAQEFKIVSVIIRLFRGNSVFGLSILAAVFNYAAIFAVAYLMSIYLQLARGLNADISGLILIAQPLIQAALSPVAGRLSDKRPSATIASIGMACCAGALVMFAFLDGQTPIPYILAGLLLIGFGIAFFSSPNANVILGLVPKSDYSITTSLLSTARTFGQAIGMALLTVIINAVVGNMPIADVAPSAIVIDVQVTFAVFAGICVCGVFFSLRRHEKSR